MPQQGCGTGPRPRPFDMPGRTLQYAKQDPLIALAIAEAQIHLVAGPSQLPNGPSAGQPPARHHQANIFFWCRPQP